MPSSFSPSVSGFIIFRPPKATTGATQTLSPPKIVGPRNFINPVVAGPIAVPTLIGPRALPAPTIKLQQRITPAAAIVGPRSLPAPTVSHVQAIFPATLVGPRALPAPTIQGAAQHVNVPTLIGPRSVSIPAVSGGLQTLQLILGGVDMSTYLSATGAGTNAAPVQIQSQTIGRWTAKFDFNNNNDVTKVPVLGQTVILQENGIKLFGGCIDTIVIDREWNTNRIVYHCTALDKTSICDRRVIPTKTYAAGATALSTILDIVSNYLNGEGITTQGLPTDESLGNLSSDLVCNYPTVRDAFDRIATQTGSVWWVDVNGVLYFSTFANLPPAPFSITETSKTWRSMLVTQSLSGGSSTSGYRNKQYAVTNLNVLPGSGTGGSAGAGGTKTETFTWATSDPNIVVDPNTGFLIALQVSLPIGKVVSMTVNGNAQSVINFSQYTGQTRTGSNDYLWFYGVGGGNQRISPTYLDVPASAVVVVNYIPGTITNAAAVMAGTALAPENPSGDPFGTCGSGVFEAVQQVKDISSQADLDAIAEAILARSGGIPTIVDYETDKTLLAVGMVQDFYVPLVQIPTTALDPPVSLLIVKISGHSEAGPLQYGSRFRWRITAVSNHDPGNWVTYFSRWLSRSENAMPVLQYEVKTFVISPGTSVGSGIVSTNPVYADRTGLLVEIYAGCDVASVDEDTVLTVTDITQGVVLGTVTIPAGSTDQVTLTVPSTSQIYVFAKDQLQVSVSFNVTGGSPTPPSSITLCIRTAM